MKMPMPPPSFDALLSSARNADPDRLVKLVARYSPLGSANDLYLPWDKLRYKSPPDDLTHEEWWMTIKMARLGARRKTSLTDREGREFTYVLPDAALRAIEEIDRSASGGISMSEQVTNPATRDRYLVNSLIEEAIASSQLEGAATTRAVAKEMLRTGRAPRDRDERMIFNNCSAMRRISGLKDVELTPDLIREIHRTVTDGTLGNPDSPGRFQRPGEERVAVYGDHDSEQPLHRPPPAEEIPARVQDICDFANGSDRGNYVPPVLRAITVHFMLGYVHPFKDGNGRTARALFYWSMLRNGYWLAEFVSISRVLREAPSQYMHSYVHVAQDDSDLTYFHIYYLEVIGRAIRDLNSYLARKIQDVREFQQSVSVMPGVLNNRQIALLEKAVKGGTSQYTTFSHASSHSVTQETARKDLVALERYGLLSKHRAGHAFIWAPVSDMPERLRRL